LRCELPSVLVVLVIDISIIELQAPPVNYSHLVNSAMTDRQTDRHESSSGDDIITSRDMIDYVGDEVVNSRLQITEAAWNAGMPPHGHPAVRIGTLVHCIRDDDGCVILSATVDDDIYKGHCTALHCRMHSRL